MRWRGDEMDAKNSASSGDDFTQPLWCTKKRRLTNEGWWFVKETETRFYAIHHAYRIITFAFQSLQDVVDAVERGLLDDPGIYELYLPS